MKKQEQVKLRKFVNELKSIRGRHTELVSIYIPAGYDMNKIINHVAQEQGTASNIKDKTTRNNVIDSLEKIVRHLRLFKRTPDNGLAVFAGNVAAQEGKIDLKLWSVEPPEPLNMRLYRCDQTFVTDILENMIENKVVYGLVAMDNRDAAIGLLRGTSITMMKELTSGVPGKTRAGGQCILPETLIQLSDGNIIEIKDGHNPNIVKSFLIEDNNFKDSPIIKKWETSKNGLYNIITKYPRLEINSSKDHVFFVFDNGIKKKAAEELKEGDYLLMPEKIDINGSLQLLNTNYYNFYHIKKSGIDYLIKRRKNLGLSQNGLQKILKLHQAVISAIERGKYVNFRPAKLKNLCVRFDIYYDWFLEKYTKPNDKIVLPNVLTPKLAQLIGYLIGDGNIEKDRLNLYDASKPIAEYYKKEFSELFNANSSLRFRKNKNYYETRIHGRPLGRFFKSEFPEIKKALDTKIPVKILKSKEEVIRCFIKGVFDAEGYVSDDALALGMNNKIFIQQLQMLLLRLGIISSFNEYDNRRNPYSDNHRFTLRIGDKTSLILFRKLINFRSEEKYLKLDKLIKFRVLKGNKIRKIAISGQQVRKLIEKEGLLIKDFPKVTNFFRNERQMSRFVFKDSIINCVKNNKKLYNKLKLFLDYKLIPVKINKINIKKGKFNLVDISVKNQNFIANGILVHNSSVRFARLREIAAHEFYQRIGDVVNKEFSQIKDLKGILVGGPGMTKQYFVDGNYLHTEIKKKVIAMKDLSYTGDFGLNELVERSKDVLAQEEITKEKEIVNELLTMLAIHIEKVAYGREEVRKTLEMGAVQKLLISEVFDALEEFEELAAKYGAEVFVISVETKEGAQLRDLGGIAAILRYAIS